jgi:hypothetical protein
LPPLTSSATGDGLPSSCATSMVAPFHATLHARAALISKRHNAKM